MYEARTTSMACLPSRRPWPTDDTATPACGADWPRCRCSQRRQRPAIGPARSSEAAPRGTTSCGVAAPATAGLQLHGSEGPATSRGALNFTLLASLRYDRSCSLRSWWCTLQLPHRDGGATSAFWRCAAPHDLDGNQSGTHVPSRLLPPISPCHLSLDLISYRTDTYRIVAQS